MWIEELKYRYNIDNIWMGHPNIYIKISSCIYNKLLLMRQWKMATDCLKTSHLKLSSDEIQQSVRE